MTSARIPSLHGTVSIPGSEVPVSQSYVAGPPSDAPITISRQALSLLSLVDISLSARRVLDQLLSLQAPETGAADVSQDEMCVLLGTNKPSVNRGFQELRACGLAWPLRRGRYQLHPMLTDGRIAATVMAVPEIQASAAEGYSEQKRARFAAQVANLQRTA